MSDKDTQFNADDANDWRDEEISRMQITVIKQGEMLAEIVNIIRGEPEHDTAHSTHDAAALVRDLKMHCDQYAMATQITIDALSARCKELVAASKASRGASRYWFNVHEISDASLFAEVSDEQFKSMLISLDSAFKARENSIAKENS
jgi:hypothetical protein